MLDIYVYRLDIYNKQTNIVLDKDNINVFNLDYIPFFLRDISQDIILEFINNENKRINKIMENKKVLR